jgi:hypothetical protein
LDSLLNNNSLEGSIAILSHNNKGFIAPPSLFKTANGSYDIVVQAFNGRIARIRGIDFSLVWDFTIPGTESSAAPIIGNFTGNSSPDVFAVVAKGASLSYSDFYQILLDGESGNLVFLDSIGSLHFASANAVDLNNDGRDEAIISTTHFDAGVFKHRLHSIDFQQNLISQIGTDQTGVNLASTPLIRDLDGNNQLDIVYVVKRDSTNPTGWKGIYVNRLELAVPVPNAGIAWGSYMGNMYDGKYYLGVQNCGTGSVIASSALSNPSCNSVADGSIVPTPLNINAILVTLDVSQLPITWLKAEALINIPAILVTLLVAQLLIVLLPPLLNALANANISPILVTLAVFQLPMF